MTNIRGGLELSDEQIQIVDATASGIHPITVVSAGAGSGKTRTMVATVLHIIEKEGGKVGIDDFALITFTNKATDEMRERLEQGVANMIQQAEKNNDEVSRRYWFQQKERISSTFVGTIHSFCSMLLRTFGYDEMVPHENEILVARRHFIKALKETLNEAMDKPSTSILFRSHEVRWAMFEMSNKIEEWYERIRGNGRQIEEVYRHTLNQPDDPEKPYRTAVAEILYMLDRRYEQIKQSLGGMDPNDLLHKAAVLMEQQYQQVGSLLRTRFHYLFVDEFQDTDRLQKCIIEKLFQYLTHILVVGDRKQAIYGFRGADDSIIVRIAEENNVDLMSLNASRRPTKPLNEVQTVLFKNMGSRYSVMQELLITPPDAQIPADSIVPFQYQHIYSSDKSDWIQAAVKQVQAFMAKQIDTKKGTRPMEYKDICILFRSNNQMDAYEQAFKEAKIPVIKDTDGGFFRKKEILDCYYMIQAILKYRDDVSLDLALGTPFLPFRPPVHIYRQDGTVSPLCDWFESEDTCRDWYNCITTIRKRMKIDLVPQLLTSIYEFTRVREFFKQQDNAQAIANLEKLVMWAREQMNAEALTLQQFFDRFQTAMLADQMLDEADTGQEVKEKQAVRFSTVHSSKGLEYPIVIIPDIHRKLLNEHQKPEFFDIERDNWGLDMVLPGGRGASTRYKEWIDTYQKNLLEEEARVFYVAVTRAQHAVCLLSGGKKLWTNSFPSEWWSWKDEVLSAQTALRRLGPTKVILS